MKAVEPPVVSTQVDYIWETSIPQSWVRLKGKEHFRHTPQVSLSTNTIDFLRRTQQYMSAFAQPAKSPSPRYARPRASDRSHSDCESPKCEPQREINLAMCGRSEFSRGPIDCLPVVPATWRHMQVNSSVKQDFHDHIISRLSLPRKTKKLRSSVGPSNRSVEKFLHRFEEQQKLVRPRTMRKGFAAQKLPVRIPRMQHKTRSWDRPDLKIAFPLN